MKNLIRTLLVVSLIQLISFSAPKAFAVTGSFVSTGNLSVGRESAAAALLQDGKVLVVGGAGISKSAELFDSSLGTFSFTNSQANVARAYGMRATTLQDGRVLITGGIDAGTGHSTNKAEIYDPTTGLFTLTFPMLHSRVNHTATLLANGKVLMAGGQEDGVGLITETELFDPLTETFSLTGSLSIGRDSPTATLLQDGKVLVVGGDAAFNAGQVSELYDSNSETWTTVASTNYYRIHHTAVLMSDGRVLVVGGGQNTDLAPAEIYDPTTNSFSLTGSLNYPRSWLTSAVLQNGMVLIAGGSINSNSSPDAEVVGELYNPASGTFQITGQLQQNRIFNPFFVAPVLLNGKVLVLGGAPSNAVVELFDQNSTYFYRPQIIQIGDVTINEHDTYSYIGGFADPDSTSWTGTVNYGDGSGDEILSISGTSFNLVHQYNEHGNYTITISVTDEQGNVGTSAVNINVLSSNTTLFPTSDSYIKQGSQNENEGSSTFIRLQSTGHNRGIVKFDEGQIQGAVGNSQNYTAKLQFTITDNGNNWGTSGRTIEVHRLIQDWVEGNGFIDGNSPSNRGTGIGATWNCATDTNIANFNNDCSGSTAWSMDNSGLWPFIATPTDTKIISNNQTGMVEFDVTTDVQSFINGSNTNYGWIIKKTDEGANGKVLFGSRESSNPPKLIITFN